MTMYPVIAPLYGPLAINSYGTAILAGVLLFLWLSSRTALGKKLIEEDHFYALIFWNILAGIIGGRLLFILSEWKNFQHWPEYFTLWDGGFSILGTVGAIAFTTSFYLKKYHLPFLQTLDLFALNAGIMQGFGRIGCFLAGCCYGIPTKAWWGVTFTNPKGLAPLCLSLVPTQLLSALLFFMIVGLMYVCKPLFKRPGQLTLLYLSCGTFERFIVDFWRADRILGVANYSLFRVSFFSLHQWIALGLFLLFFTLFLTFTFSSHKPA